MKEFFELFSSERRMLRDYAIMALGIVAGTLVLAQVLVAMVGTNLPPETQRLNVIEAANAAKTYTITRSVLDDPINTGAINQIRLDPCKK